MISTKKRDRTMEQAQLHSMEGSTEFIAAARDGLASREQDLSALGRDMEWFPETTREQWVGDAQAYRDRVEELRIRVDELAARGAHPEMSGG